MVLTGRRRVVSRGAFPRVKNAKVARANLEQTLRQIEFFASIPRRVRELRAALGASPLELQARRHACNIPCFVVSFLLLSSFSSSCFFFVLLVARAAGAPPRPALCRPVSSSSRGGVIGSRARPVGDAGLSGGW